MALDNFIPKNNMAECNLCSKFHRETVTCEKFKGWIPQEKPVGVCPDFEPDEEQMRQQEEWNRKIRKMVDEMVANSKNQTQEEKQKEI